MGSGDGVGSCAGDVWWADVPPNARAGRSQAPTPKGAVAPANPSVGDAAVSRISFVARCWQEPAKKRRRTRYHGRQVLPHRDRRGETLKGLRSTVHRPLDYERYALTTMYIGGMQGCRAPPRYSNACNRIGIQDAQALAAL